MCPSTPEQHHYTLPVRTGYLPVVECLLEAKADPNIPLERMEQHHYIIASQNGHLLVVEASS